MSDASLTPAVTEVDHVAGPAGAPVTLVEYGDFECPHCGRAYSIIKRLQQLLSHDLRFVFRNFPLKEQHPHAAAAAESAEAAGAQGQFWPMHDALFQHQDALENEDLVEYAGEIGIDSGRVARELSEHAYASRVREQFRSGVRSGVNGTPTFFINGRRFDGDWESEAEFRAALEPHARASLNPAHDIGER